MRSSWARGAASAVGALLGLFGLGSCALVLDYGDYEDRPSGGAAAGGAGGAGSSTGQGGDGGCVPDAMVDCYSGPAATKDVGLSHGGKKTCNHEGTAYGPCEGEVTPTAEICRNKVDEDCNGVDCGAPLWAARFGGDGDQALTDLGLDESGNVFFTGFYQGQLNLPDALLFLPPGPGVEVFAAKVGPEGMDGWAKDGIMGGATSLPRAGAGIAVDKTGNLVVAGRFNDAASPQTDNGFVMQRSAKGDEKWVEPFGGSGVDWALGTAVDASGNVYVIASYTATFELSGHTIQNQGKGDVLLIKYNAAGAYAWSLSFGDAELDTPWGIAVDPAGNVLVTGEYRGKPGNLPDAKIGMNAASGIFAMKVDGKGNVLWRRGFLDTLPDASNPRGLSIAADKDGNAWITGALYGTIDFSDDGTGALTSSGKADVFLVELKSADGGFLRGQAFGDKDDQVGSCVVVAEDGSVFVAGTFSGTLDFGAGNELVNLDPTSVDLFLVKFDPAGAPRWSAHFAAGAEPMGPHFVRVAAGKGAVVIGGGWAGPLAFGVGDTAAGKGGSDIFLAKFAQ